MWGKLFSLLEIWSPLSEMSCPTSATLWKLTRIMYEKSTAQWLAHSSVNVCMPSHFSCVWLFVTPWTVACQAAQSIGFSRQESWSELPCPTLGNLSKPGIEPTPPALGGEFFTAEPPAKSLFPWHSHLNKDDVILFTFGSLSGPALKHSGRPWAAVHLPHTFVNVATNPGMTDTIWWLVTPSWWLLFSWSQKFHVVCFLFLYPGEARTYRQQYWCPLYRQQDRGKKNR